MLDFASFIWSSVITSGGMSVSGYILDAPGRGLKNTVSPLGVAPLVSAGTPFFASSIRLIIESIAKSILEFSPAMMIKPSLELISSNFCKRCISEFSIP